MLYREGGCREGVLYRRGYTPGLCTGPLYPTLPYSPAIKPHDVVEGERVCAGLSTLSRERAVVIPVLTKGDSRTKI